MMIMAASYLFVSHSHTLAPGIDWGEISAGQVIFKNYFTVAGINRILEFAGAGLSHLTLDQNNSYIKNTLYFLCDR